MCRSVVTITSDKFLFCHFVKILDDIVCFSWIRDKMRCKDNNSCGKTSPIFWQIIRFFHHSECYWNNNLVVIFLTANSRIITELPNLLSDSGLPGTPPLTQSGQAPQASGRHPSRQGKSRAVKTADFFLPGTARRKNIGKNLAVNKFYAAKHWEIKAYE